MAAQNMARTLPRVLSTAAKAAVTILLLALLFRKIDYSATLQHLRDIRPLTAIASILILSAAVAVATARWSIVLQSMGRRFTGWTLFRFNLIGQFFNQALPSTIGGDGVRLWLVYQQGCTFAEAFNSVLIDRMSGFLVLALMSLYGLPTLVERMFAIPPGETVAVVIVVVVALLAVLYGLARGRARIARYRAGRFVAQIVTDMMFLAARPRDAAKIAALSVGAQLAAFLLIWLILRDLGADVSVVGVMIVAPVVMLLLVLPVSIAGWGLREGLFVLGFGLLNVRQELALAASIVFGLINLAEGLIGGIFWLLQPARVRGPIAAAPAVENSFAAQESLAVDPSLAEPPSKPA
jgi:glycosyltransferase 2 family protein